MNNSFKNIRLAILSLLIMLFSSNLSFAHEGQEIVVNQSKKGLTAPNSCQYQWFLNDHKLPGEGSQDITVNEPGVYSVETVDENGSISRTEAMVMVSATGAIVKIYLIGDSTVCNYAASAYPMMGWGQMIAYFFNKANVIIDNRAIGGRSSRSFYEEGRWTTIRDALKTGDFVFIQFGHNDRDTKPERYTSTHDYKKFLTIYVTDTRAKGGLPVLVSPMVMNAWRNGVMRNVFTEAGNDYRGAMKIVADSLKVPFVDLNLKSWNLYKSLGVNYLDRFIYHTYPAGEYPNYPTGNSDGTHFKISGATENARMVVEGLKELTTDLNIKNSLVANLLPTYVVNTFSNLKGADSMISRSVSYPPGIEVTVKVVPKRNATFLKWNNQANTQMTTDLKYIFTMGSAPVNFTAMFKGGVVTGIEGESEDFQNAKCYPNPFTQEVFLKLDGHFTYTVFDMNGIKVENGSGLNGLNAGQNLPIGSYVIEIQNGKNIFREKILKK